MIEWTLKEATSCGSIARQRVPWEAARDQWLATVSEVKAKVIRHPGKLSMRVGDMDVQAFKRQGSLFWFKFQVDGNFDHQQTYLHSSGIRLKSYVKAITVDMGICLIKVVLK